MENHSWRRVSHMAHAVMRLLLEAAFSHTLDFRRHDG